MRPGIWQIVLVIVLLFILFGSNKIPDMMKNLAGGINVFKKELKDDKKQEATPQKKVVAKKPDAKKAVAKKGIEKKVTAKKSIAKKTSKK